MAGSLVPDVGNVSINTAGALKNLMDASRDLQSAYMTPVNRLEKYEKEAELRDRLEKEDALKAEALAYSRGRDAKNDLIAKEDRDYLLGQRKNKEDFMKSISEPGVDALDDTILKRTNDLAASKWNEANPISDADAAKLNDYYVKNQKILAPTLDPENLRSYIGSQALKYGVDPSTATSTYEMFKPDKKETGLTDMEKLLIQNELGMQRDVNKLNAEKALGNEKYDGKTGNSSTGAKKDKAGSIGSDFASNAADINKLELDTDIIDLLGATSEKEKALGLYTNLSKTYSPKDIANVIKASISSGGEINDDTVKTLLSNIPVNVSKSDANSTTGAVEKVEYTPAIDLQSMIAKSTKVDKGKLAEDMFEREFGIPKGKSGGIGSTDNESGRVPIVDKNGKVSRVEGIPDSLQLNERLELKAYEDAGGLAVGYGYNYSTKSTPELIKDFKQAGLSDYLLEDAAAGKKITLTKDEANKLAKVAYKNHGTEKANKLINNFDKLDPMMQEIASDMAYRGDLVPGENGYRGTLSNLLEQGDLNKLYEYVDNSSKVPQAVKNRLGNILTVERDRPIKNLIDESNNTRTSPSKAPEVSDNKDINSSETIRQAELNTYGKQITPEDQIKNKDNALEQRLAALDEKYGDKFTTVKADAQAKLINERKDELGINFKNIDKKATVSKFLENPDSLDKTESNWMNGMQNTDKGQAELRKLLLEVKKPTEQMIQESKGKKIVDKMLNDENSLTADERRWIASMRMNPNGRSILEQYIKEMKN